MKDCLSQQDAAQSIERGTVIFSAGRNSLEKRSDFRVPLVSRVVLLPCIIRWHWFEGSMPPADERASVARKWAFPRVVQRFVNAFKPENDADI